MALNLRQYDRQSDFERVGQFLLDYYRDENNLRLWIQPRWEYMHFHPFIWQLDLSTIAVVEEDGQMAGLAHFEHDPGIVYLQVPPDSPAVKEMLLDYALDTFRSVDRHTGRERLVIFVNQADGPLQDLAASRGFAPDGQFYEVMSRYDLTKGVPEVDLPAGFVLQSLAEENDLRKINQVLWRGFNHPGPPPEEELTGRAFMQQAPNFRPDLTMVVVAPNGDFVSYCGIWFVDQNRLTYVEPVATDPDYRRMGLGRAAVLEGIRRTIPLGSQTAWVGSQQAFYLSMGFEVSYWEQAWVRFF